MLPIRRLPALSEKIVDLAQEHGWISIAYLSTVLAANRNMVKKHVQQLGKKRRVVRHGERRGPIVLHSETDKEV